MARTVRVDQIEASQRSFVEWLIAASGTEGELAAVVIGDDESWDVRPLVMRHGALYVVRASQPTFDSRGRQAAQVLHTVDTLHALPVYAEVACGETEGRLWLRRRFAPRVLDEFIDPLATEKISISSHQLVSVANALDAAHRVGIFHGHLVGSNIAVDGEQWRLQDFAWWASGCARRGENGVLSAGEDVLRLGRIFERLAGYSEDLSQWAGLFAQMATPEAANRPALGEVIDRLSGGSPGGKVPARARRAATEIVIPSKDGAAGQRAKEHIQSAERVVSQATNRLKEQTRGLIAELRARRGLMAATGIIFGLLVVLIIVTLNAPTPLKLEEAKPLWASDDPIRMRTVADDIIDYPLSDVARFVADDLKKGHQPPRVRSGLLKAAFDPRWERDLSENDRRAVWLITFQDITDVNQFTRPAASSLHPGVLLAMVGTLGFDIETKGFDAVPIEILERLPGILGQGFTLLKELGSTTLGARAPRAFAHLVLGDVSIPIVEGYFVRPTDAAITLKQLRMLIPSIAKFPQMEDPVFRVLQSSSAAIARMIEWFDEKQYVDWSATTRLQRIGLMVGEFPPNMLSSEQYSDLLTFPNADTQRKAREALSESEVSKAYRGMLVVLGSPANKLSRTQTVILVNSFQLADEQAYTLLSTTWFPQHPDPETIFLLLVSRSKSPRSAPFDIEASRYLIGQEWDAAAPELSLLVHHPESLARALAYSRLNPQRAEDRKILEAAAATESDARLKQEVLAKLSLTAK